MNKKHIVFRVVVATCCVVALCGFGLYGLIAFAAPMGNVNFTKGSYDGDRWGSEFYVDKQNSTTYCMHPGWESPDEGTYSTTKLTKSDVEGHMSGSGNNGVLKGNWHDFCLVLYYGYGGKGYNASEFSSHVGSSFKFRCGAGPSFSGSAHDAYLVTHFFLGLSYGHIWGTGDNPPQWQYYKTYYDSWIAWARQKAVSDNLDVDKLELYQFSQSGRQTMVSFVTQDVPSSSGYASVVKKSSM